MVYLNLSVENFDESIKFYDDVLGLFDSQSSTRLIFKLDAELIIDLHEVGSDSHADTFGGSGHAPSSFWVHVGDEDGFSEISIFERLKTKRVNYQEVNNLGGHRIRFLDPSGNKFSIHAHGGVFR